ncbi:DUF1566 domain-containing protein [Burkholderia contaminans]|uniref:DUF1566 domain-containing protein n=1 Tax=Burkholderia contaminans TaxID=488447 RepID=UPI0018DDA7C2|nr:DUF1566 domain-containing protein [Burkholderia contaminans]MBH9725146.1 DUF1566 domain-containing protein [Burkholderia contaminans]
MQKIELPVLNDGEIYLGGFVDSNGNVSHTILLPGDHNGATWQQQKDWAASIGGDLPTRVELAVVYEKDPAQFTRTWYWAKEESTDQPGWGWFHTFSLGYQNIAPGDNKYRARAVRRVTSTAEFAQPQQ